MKPNVGGLDRTARIVIGVVLLLIAGLAPVTTVWKIIAIVVAVIALATAGFRYCPINAAMGVNTAAPRDEGKK